MDTINSVGDAPVDSGTVTDTQASNEAITSQEKEPSKSVAWDDHKRALEDLHKFKARAKALETAQKEAEKKAAAAAGNWQVLAEQNEKEALEWKQKHEQLNQAYVHTKRFDAVRAEALRLGLRPEAEGDLELIDMDQVDVEVTNTGRFIVKNAETKAQELKRVKPHWFKDVQAPRVNTGGSMSAPGENAPISAMDILNMEKQVKAGKMKREDYHAAYQKFALSKMKQ